MGIVHLEMINILVATKLFKNIWSGYKILVQCDNEAVVSVLLAGETQETLLGGCACNIWYLAALENIHLQYVHIPSKRNVTVDLLSRWTGSTQDMQILNHLVVNPQWVPVTLNHLELNNEM